MKGKVALLAVVGVLGAAGAASADTSVTNSWTNRHEYNGYGSNKTTVDRMVTGTQINESQSIKLEADKGTFNAVDVKFDGYKFTGSAVSNNRQPIDPVVYGGYTKQTEVLKVSENVNSFSNESYQFNSNSYSHTVGTSSW